MAVRHTETRGRAKALRKSQTGPETLLWLRLRAGRLGVKFQRQVVIAPWIADFAARSHRLVIELDGESHLGREAYDEARTRDLEARGWRVLRVTNGDVLSNMDGVLRAILIALERDPNLPRPLQGDCGGECRVRPGDEPAAAMDGERSEPRRGGSGNIKESTPHSPRSPRR